LAYRRRYDQQLTIVAFITPPLAVYCLFVVLPVFRSFQFSLYNWDGIGPLDRFVGWGNYNALLRDPTFWLALRNNLILVVASLITQLPPALFLAVLLTGRIRGREFFRTVFFSPQIMSTVATGYLFSFFYSPELGPLNAILRAAGLGDLARPWLGDQALALPAVISVISWRHLGFYMVLFMAAIEGLPDDVLDAAQVDGCTQWQLVRYVIIPMISGTIRTAAVLATVGSMKYFDLIWVMTGGGPVHASELVATYMFKETFMSGHMGYGAALAFVLFSIAFGLSLALLWSTARRERTQGTVLAVRA